MHRDEAQRQRTTQRAAVDLRQEDADRGLIARVEHLVATCPPDRLPTLDDQITRLSSRRDALAGSIERERLAIDEKTLERTAATRAGTAAGNRRHDLARKIARADGLAVREAAATETRAEASGSPSGSRTNGRRRPRRSAPGTTTSTARTRPFGVASR